MQGYPEWVHPSSMQFCVAPRCASTRVGESDATDWLGAGPRPRHPVPGSDLCAHHELELGQLLGALVTTLRELRRAVRSTVKRDSANRPGNTSTVVDVGARWNPAASPAARLIEEYTAFLVRTVLAERILPAGHRHGLTTHTEASLALATLARHHSTWLARYPDLGPDILDTLRDLARRANSALAIDPVQRVIVRDPAGEPLRCADEVLATDLGPVLCEAPLVAIVTPTGGDVAADRLAGHIVCSADPDHTRYGKGDWWQLNIGRPADALDRPVTFVSLEVAAAALNLSPRRTAEIASAERWRTAGTRPEQYAIDDITRTAQLRGAHT